MSSSATVLRTTVKKAIVDQLAALDALAGVQVTYGWPGKSEEDEGIWCGAIKSVKNAIPSMKAGRKPREDRFVIETWIHAAVAGQTTLEAEQRVEVLYGVVDDFLARKIALGGGIAGLVSCVLELVDGPGTDDDDMGAVSAMRLEIACHTRLT